MKKNKKAVLSLLFLGFIISLFLFIIIGCGGGGGGGGGGGISPVYPTPTPTGIPSPTPTPSGLGTLEGRIVNSDGGSAVNAATVTIFETSQTTTTNANGYFSLNLNAGVYTVIVTKAGCAESKSQSVNISGGSTTTLELTQMTAYDASWTASSPTISISGITHGSSITSNTSITINVTGSNPISKIYGRVGNKHSTKDYISTNSTTLNFTLIPSELPHEDTYLYISAYDTNNNRSEITIGFRPYGGSVSPIYFAPINILAFAMTYAESLGTYEARIQNLQKENKLPTDFNPDEIELPDGKKVDIKAAPANSTCYVLITWDEIVNAQGYKIYRSTSEQGTYSLVGETIDGSYTEFYDKDPSLSPGDTLYYKVSGYNEYGEGPKGNANRAVTILGKFTINLSSPANKEVGTSQTPNLSWNINDTIGDERRYTVRVYEYNGDGSYVWGHTTSQYTTDTSINVATTLTKNTVYEWEVVDGRALGSYDPISGYWCAYSYPKRDVDEDGYNYHYSNNGSFIFTTLP